MIIDYYYRASIIGARSIRSALPPASATACCAWRSVLKRPTISRPIWHAGWR